MIWTTEIRRFIEEHQDGNPDRLLLNASHYPGIDVSFAVEQIKSRRQIKDKLPSWYADTALYFPSGLAAEQCSSELTALYKQRLVDRDDALFDLTGGLGIDSLYFAGRAGKVYYCERHASCCEAARHNFRVLKAENIEVYEGDAVAMLDRFPDVSVFYIDPARRGGSNRRMYALQDCEPDLTKLLPALLERAPKVITKISPMADLRHTLGLLPSTSEIHVVSVNNECKELLFVMRPEQAAASPAIHCVNLHPSREETPFIFTLDEEKEASVPLACAVGAYLYEPDASILKAGAFKQVALFFGVDKLAVSSHLYTSNRPVSGFPGRSFRVDSLIPFHRKEMETISKEIPQANITVRNFPLTAEKLRKRIGIKEGGDIYLFATTLNNGERVLIKTRKAGVAG